MAGSPLHPGLLVETTSHSPGSCTGGALPGLTLLLPPWGARYPVILSIENHCSVVQQKKMAQYLTDILGDKLDLSSVSSEDATMLPSPQMLKGKVLVKVSPSLAPGPPTGALAHGLADWSSQHRP